MLTSLEKDTGQVNEILYCAHFVLKPTSIHPTQAYSSQSSDFGKTLVSVGLSRVARAVF